MFQKHGGVSRYFTSIYTHVKETYNKNTRITAFLYINSYLKAIRMKNGGGIYLPNSILSSPLKFRCVKLINSIREFFLLFFSAPDIHHMTYYDRIPLKLSKTKVVVSVYDMIHELFPDQFPDKVRLVKKKCIEGADLIICISENTKTDLIRLLGIDEKKIRVIYIGFKGFDPKNSISIVSLTCLDNPYILFVGQRTGYKNFDKLVKAFSSSEQLLQDFNLVCLGGGKFTKHEVEMFNTLNINDKLYQIDAEDDMLQKCYQNASVFVYPSLYEGFGIPPLEAMSCKTPVCCSNTSSLPEVVGDAAMLFDPDDVESIKDAMIKVLYNPRLREELISKGEMQIQNFTWEKCAKETFQAYKTIL